MAALGWMLNLGFGGGEAAVYDATTFAVTAGLATRAGAAAGMVVSAGSVAGGAVR